MKDELRTIEEWEAEQGKMVINTEKLDLSTPISEKEFSEISADNEVGIVLDSRLEWLRVNKYEDTRENRMNVDLPSRPELWDK